MLNLNNVPDDDNNREFGLIPDGTIARGFVKLSGGELDLPEFGVGNFFKSSQSTSAKWLPIEVTIAGGSFDKRKVWQNVFVDGNKLSERGMPIAKEIGLRTLKSMIDSAFNLSSKDDTPEAQAARNLNGVGDLNGVSICFVIGVEKGTNGYEDKNKIKAVLTADSKGFIPAGSPATSAPAQSPAVQAPAYSQPAQPQQVAATQGGITPSWASK